LDPIEHLALRGISAVLVGPRRVLAERMNATIPRVTVLSCMAGIVCLWVMILSTKFRRLGSEKPGDAYAQAA